MALYGHQTPAHATELMDPNWVKVIDGHLYLCRCGAVTSSFEGLIVCSSRPAPSVKRWQHGVYTFAWKCNTAAVRLNELLPFFTHRDWSLYHKTSSRNSLRLAQLVLVYTVYGFKAISNGRCTVHQRQIQWCVYCPHVIYRITVIFHGDIILLQWASSSHTHARTHTHARSHSGKRMPRCSLHNLECY